MTPIIVNTDVPATPADYATIAACVRRKLHDYPQETYLTALYTALGTTITVNDPDMFALGNEWDFDDLTGETILSRSGTSNPITIKYGHRGTINQNHASGAVLRKSPRFTIDEIGDALTQSIDGLFPTAYAINTTTITYSTTTVNYLAPSDFEFGLAATQKGTETTNISYLEFGFDGSLPGKPSIFIKRGLRTADFASTIAFYVPSWYNTTEVIDVTYAAKVTSSTISTGLMADTVCWGACAALLGGGAILRSAAFNPSDPAASDVTDSLRAAANARAEYEKGKRMLARRLATTHRRPLVYRS